jgi:uncharacterized protein (DUF849 family)
VNNLPENAKVCFGGIGKDQLNSNVLGLIYGDGVRVGLEDNLYYTDKVKTTNIKLLQRIRKIMDEMGIPIMSHFEFSRMGFKNLNT